MKKIKLLLGLTAALIMTAPILTGCSSDVEIDLGSWNGNIYTNESLGLTFTMPEHWIINDDTETDDGTIIMAAGNMETGAHVGIILGEQRLSPSRYVRGVVDEFRAAGVQARVISGTVRIGDKDWHQYTLTIEIDRLRQSLYGFNTVQGRCGVIIKIAPVGDETLADILSMFN